MMSVKSDVKTNGQPEKLHIQLSHYKQKFNWDCGISCVLMVLPRKCRLDLIKNFSRICREEGFNRSTWTIDLCYLLARYRIEHVYYTVTLGVHPGYRGHKFYSHILTKDESRVNRKFKCAQDNGVVLKKASVTFGSILDHLIKGPVIVLTNAKLLHCDICKMNKISTELRKCIPIPVTYQGHYIVLCGYDVNTRKILYRNPALVNRVCAMSIEAFEDARKSYGTDEDVIFVFT